MPVDDEEMAATGVTRAPLMGPEGAAQKARKKAGKKRPAETNLEEAELVGLVSITGPPWYDEATGKELDPQEVALGMKKETDSLNDFGTYVWVPEEMAEQKGVVVIKSRWLLGERDGGERVQARVVAQQLNKGSPLDTYAAAQL
eukprot:4308336-Heterocapsa_arctica.AAC.1